jgi:hypothetical protein
MSRSGSGARSINVPAVALLLNAWSGHLGGVARLPIEQQRVAAAS